VCVCAQALARGRSEQIYHPFLKAQDYHLTLESCRFGQKGVGPQLLKGKIGDNVIDMGLLGAAGTGQLVSV
jgi:hypothetical protein